MLLSIVFLLLVARLFKRNLCHVLNCLIFLELIVIYLFWAIFTLMESGFTGSLTLILYFVISVASASLGLAILIVVCRSHGQDYLFSYNLMF